MKRFLFLLAALVMSVSGVWAQDWENHGLTVSPDMVEGEFAAGTVFYTINQKGNGGTISVTSLNGNYIALSSTSSDDNARWAILGNSETGYQFVNKATKKYIKCDQADAANRSSNKNASTFVAEDGTYFQIAKSIKTTSESAQHHVVKIKADGNHYWNKQDGKLAIWNSAEGYTGWNNSGNGDDGSKFLFTQVEVLNNVTVENVNLNITNANMNIGQLQELTATISPAEASQAVSIASDNEAVACVVDGKIQAISEGTATITVTSEKDPTKTATCQVTVTKQDWYIHVSPEMGINSQGGRVVSQISINGTSITVPSYTYPYVDLTAQKFTVDAGATLQAGLTNIGWMHSMVYLNQNDDNQFTENEMVTHSTLTGGSGTNSGIATFTAPSETGTYRMRFKTDWHGDNPNGNDPAGRIGDDGTLTGNNSIWANRGVIIDVMLEVTAPVERTTVTYKVTNAKNEEVDVVAENVAIGSQAEIPVVSGYFTEAAFTETDLEVRENNKVFHVTGTWAFPIEDNKCYTMHSTKTDEYQDYVCNGTEAWCNGSVTIANNNNVWQFALVSGTLDLFTVKNYGHNKYAVLSGSGRNACTFADEPTVWESGTGATSYFRVVKQEGGFNLQHPGDPTTNVGSHVDYKFGSWQNDNSATNASSINVVNEVYILEIGATGYSTLYLEKNAEIPEGVTVYFCEPGDGKFVMLELDAETIIPKVAGVVVKGEPNTSYTFTCTEEESTEQENEFAYTLYGVDKETQASVYSSLGTVYVLSKVNDQIGFYKFVGETLKANRAFYVRSEVADVQGFVLDFGGEQTTGVSQLSTVNCQLSTVYDLAGRRVNANVKGISIANGKKIIK